MAKTEEQAAAVSLDSARANKAEAEARIEEARAELEAAKDWAEVEALTRELKELKSR